LLLRGGPAHEAQATPCPSCMRMHDVSEVYCTRLLRNSSWVIGPAIVWQWRSVKCRRNTAQSSNALQMPSHVDKLRAMITRRATDTHTAQCQLRHPACPITQQPFQPRSNQSHGHAHLVTFAQSSSLRCRVLSSVPSERFAWHSQRCPAGVGTGGGGGRGGGGGGGGVGGGEGGGGPGGGGGCDRGRAARRKTCASMTAPVRALYCRHVMVVSLATCSRP
jgi:uncharacterized membrane protein YgcG